MGSPSEQRERRVLELQELKIKKQHLKPPAKSQMTAHYDYNIRPQQFAETDFWKQVRRTINGSPVSEEQIRIIYNHIVKRLKLSRDDKLIDIGCGNGALSSLFRNDVAKIFGIDPSRYLIYIAKKYFADKNIDFEVRDSSSAHEIDDFESFNKILMYGVSSFLEDDELICSIEKVFKQSKASSKMMMIGNIRDIGEYKNFSESNLKSH